MSFEIKIKELNIKLPQAADPVGSYIAAKIVGKLLYISGQISIDDKGQLIKGKLGKCPQNISKEFDISNKETFILWGHFLLKF